MEKLRTSIKTFEQVWKFRTSMKFFRTIKLLKKVGIFQYYPRFESEESMEKFGTSMEILNKYEIL